jgi:nicotinamidase-related amidase
MFTNDRFRFILILSTDRPTHSPERRIQMEKTALIVSDMLNDFIDEKGALYSGPGARDIVPFVRRRLEAHRRAGSLVIFLQDAHAEDDLEFEKFPRHCVAGTWGSRIIEELAPQPGERVLPKTRYSGFYGTDLEKILSRYGPAEVEVVGVCTSICVMDTVGGLANRDYRTTVPRAGVADFDDESHRYALQRMERLYGATIR